MSHTDHARSAGQGSWVSAVCRWTALTGSPWRLPGSLWAWRGGALHGLLFRGAHCVLHHSGSPELPSLRPTAPCTGTLLQEPRKNGGPASRLKVLSLLQAESWSVGS